MMKKTLLLLAASVSCVLHGADAPLTPVFESDFEGGGGNAVSDRAASPLAGELRPGAVKTESPFGTTIRLEGRINNGARYPASSKLNLKSEFTVSVWFRLDALPASGAKGAGRSYTLLSLGNENWRACIDAAGRISVQNTAPGKEFFIWNSGPGAVSAGRWSHVAYTYSVSKGEYALFVDGVLKSVRKTSVDKKKIPPVPIENFSPLLIGSMPDYFPMKGEIACVRIYDRALSPQDLDGAERDRMRKLLSFLASDAEKSGETSLAGLLRKNAADPSLSLKSLQDLQKEHQSRCGGKKGTAPGKA